MARTCLNTIQPRKLTHMTNAALHVARTGLDAQNERMRVIANNLANVNTTGFKRDRASFETLAYQAMTAPGAPSSGDNKYATGLSLGSGVQIAGTARIDTQGTLQTTGNALDMAIEGNGFFQVQMPDGTHRLYPRRQFHPDRRRHGRHRRRQAADPADPGARGRRPRSRSAPTAPSRPRCPAQTESTELGKIETARFANPAGLQSLGDNILKETAAQRRAAGRRRRRSMGAARSARARSRDRTSTSSRSSST